MTRRRRDAWSQFLDSAVIGNCSRAIWLYHARPAEARVRGRQVYRRLLFGHYGGLYMRIGDRVACEAKPTLSHSRLYRRDDCVGAFTSER